MYPHNHDDSENVNEAIEAFLWTRLLGLPHLRLNSTPI